MNFADLKRAVRELARLHCADVALVEDKASGTSLIQELRADNFSKIEPAPDVDGGKIMRLRGQTAKIHDGFVHFPMEAHWLDTYLLELVTLPNAKHDDQVDSTVYALAWSTKYGATSGVFGYYKKEAEKLAASAAGQKKMFRVLVPRGTSHWQLITGRMVLIPSDRIIEVTEEEIISVLRNGGNRVA